MINDYTLGKQFKQTEEKDDMIEIDLTKAEISNRV